MKILNKILLVVLVILVLFYLGICVFVAVKGKEIVAARIQEITQKKTTIGSVTLLPPINVKIDKLNIEGLVSADSVYVSPSILGFMQGKMIFNSLKLKRPHIYYELKPVIKEEVPVPAPDAAVDAALPKQNPPTPAVQPVQPVSQLPAPVAFKSIRIKNGIVDIVDYNVSKEGLKFAVTDIDLKIINLYLMPVSETAHFDLKANIPWKDGSSVGKILLNGWINLFKKEMQGDLRIKDIDGVYLYPYYSSWVNLEKARIGKAKLNFNSDIHGLNNEITATCHLELTEMERVPRPEGEDASRAEKITNVVLDIFKALNQGKIVLDFTVKTKMDSPEFGFSNIKMALQNKIAEGRKASGTITDNVIALPGKIIEGTVKEAGDVTKSVIGTTFGIGQEFKKAVEDSFRKESTPLPVETPALVQPAPAAEAKTEAPAQVQAQTQTQPTTETKVESTAVTSTEPSK